MKESKPLSRRQFIRITASAGLMLAGGLGLANNRAFSSRQTVRVDETRLLLGTIANITVFSDQPDEARTAIIAAFDRMETLESVFSRFRPQSQLSQLNSHGYLINGHPSLQEVLARAVYYGELSDGAFDVTIEPLHSLYRESAREGRLPDLIEIETVRQLVDYRSIDLSGNTIRLAKSGMAITLDGIAKGFIVDQGAATLAEYGFADVLVEMGGDMQSLGNAESRPWQIGIRLPDGATANRPNLVVQVHGAALATSGDYLNVFTADRRAHHILDPESGISPDELASASVIAPTTCDADALSTALMVMGTTRGLAMVEQLSGVEALTITKDGEIARTTGFPLIGS